MSQLAERIGILWTPPSLLDLLIVSVDGECTEADFQGMLDINTAARDWLRGTSDLDRYFDTLADHGVDPYDFVGEVAEHVDYLESHG
jgi:hypothetical protein